MNQFTLLFHNQLLIAAVLGWLVAQLLKTGIHMYFNKSFVPERLVGSGGMPSSHSLHPVSSMVSTASSLQSVLFWQSSSCMMPLVSAVRLVFRLKS